MNGNLKKLSHHTEEATSFGLSAICKKLGAGVLMRVKVQDAFKLDGSGISDELQAFAAKSTFDYVCVDNDRTPLFVVQYDGTSHPTDLQTAKPQQENEICRKLLLPLLRIHAFHLSKKHHSLEIVGTLLETWFASKGPIESKSGVRSFSDGELFPTAARASRSSSSIPDLDTSSGAAGDVRKNIRRIYESGKCRSPVPSSVIGVDVAGNYHAVGFIRVTDDSVASAKVALRNQLFPATAAVLIEEILIHELYQELLDVIRGRGRLVTRAELGATIAAFRMRYKVKGGPVSAPPSTMPGSSL
jgi:uncharacterized protein DUF2726